MTGFARQGKLAISRGEFIRFAKLVQRPVKQLSRATAPPAGGQVLLPARLYACSFVMRVRGNVEPLQRLPFCKANDGPRPSRQTCHFAGRIHSLREIGSTSCETTFPLRQPTGKLKFQLLIQEPITKIRMFGIICQHQKDNKNTTAYTLDMVYMPFLYT